MPVYELALKIRMRHPNEIVTDTEVQNLMDRVRLVDSVTEVDKIYLYPTSTVGEDAAEADALHEEAMGAAVTEDAESEEALRAEIPSESYMSYAVFIQAATGTQVPTYGDYRAYRSRLASESNAQETTNTSHTCTHHNEPRLRYCDWSR